MRTVLYYPGFEVADEAWLKFALLYLDKLRPIVPYAGDQYFSARFRSVIDSADLVEPFRPDYDLAARGTLDAIEKCEGILARPHLFRDIFKHDNVAEAWKHVPNHTYTVFRDKYTSSWEEFILGNNLGRRVDEGVAVSKHLGLDYMTLLAQAISAEQEIPPITDRPELDSFGIFLSHTTSADPKSFRIARSIINVTVPANLDSIALVDIIAFRTRPGFKERLHAFHQRVQDYIRSSDDGSATSDFKGSQGSFWKDFSDEIASVGVGTTSAALSIWLFLDSAGTNALEYAKELSAAGALATTSVIAVRNAWNHTRVKRFTRKYLGDIQALARAT